MLWWAPGSFDNNENQSELASRVMSTKPPILELGNHARVLRILELISGRSDLSWYNEEVHAVVCRWVNLAMQHLRTARGLAPKPRNWRGVVSRSYYAAYNASRALRYAVSGSIKLDVDDHKVVGDLPPDFPNRAAWSTFLIDLRKDRNLADYEPWTKTLSALSERPRTSLDRTEEFLRQSKTYLRKKGIKL